MDSSRSQDEAGITLEAARFAVDRSNEFPSAALDFAHLSFYDFFAVALAGRDEPVSRIVRKLVASEGGAPQASAFGIETRMPSRAAALLNGTVAHALDYDDTHFAFVGHPSVAVLPAALAMAEQRQADGNVLLEAFVCGVETTCRIGAQSDNAFDPFDGLPHCATTNRARSEVQPGVHCRDGPQRSRHGGAKPVFGCDVRRHGMTRHCKTEPPEIEEGTE